VTAAPRRHLLTRLAAVARALAAVTAVRECPRVAAVLGADRRLDGSASSAPATPSLDERLYVALYAWQFHFFAFQSWG
jgi:hypothetical protein